MASTRWFLVILLTLILPFPAIVSATVEDQVRQAIVDGVSGSGEWSRIEVTDIRSGISSLPVDAVVEMEMDGTGTPLGKKNFILVASYEGQVKKFEATARVAAFSPVWYLSRPTAKGREPEPADLIRGEMDVTRIPKDAITDPAEITGLVASRPISPNVLLKKSYFVQVPLARRGDRVRLVIDDGRLHVSAAGVLKEDGVKGKMVRVTNLMSKKEVVGCLVDATTVKVSF